MSPSYKIALTLFNEMFASHAEQIRQLQSCLATAQASAGQLLEEMEGDRSRLIDLLQAAHLPTIAASIETALPVQELPAETAPPSLEPVPVTSNPVSPNSDEIRVLQEDGAETALALTGLGIIDYADLVAASTDHWAEIENLLDGDDCADQETHIGQLALFSENVPTALVADAQREISAAAVAAIAIINDSVSEEMTMTDALGVADIVEASNTTDDAVSPTDAFETVTDVAALVTPAEIAVRTPNAADLHQAVPTIVTGDTHATLRLVSSTPTPTVKPAGLPSVDVRTAHRARHRALAISMRRAIAAAAAFLLILSGSTVVYDPLRSEFASQAWEFAATY